MFVSKSSSMETITDQNTAYVIETTNDIISNNSDTKQLVFIDTPILICPNNDPPPLYVPPVYQKEKVILKDVKKQAMKRLSKTVKYKKAQNHPMNQEPVILNSTLKVTRKKLSYETEFKPSKPTTKGSYKGFIRYGRRQLIVDQQIMISTRQFRNQLNDTDDLITTTDLAPRSKQHMQRLLNGITKLFAYPARKVPNSQLLQLYVANCTSNEKPNVETVTDMELLPVGYQTPINPLSIKRITRKRKCPYMKQLETSGNKKDHTKVQLLVEATNSANDHKYSKQVNKDHILKTELIEDNYVTEESIPINIEIDDNEEVTSDDDPIKTDIEIEENEVFTIKSNEVYTVKSEDDTDDRQVVIIQKLGENIALSHKNLELLLAAANDTNQSNQVVAICNSSDLANGNRFILVQKEDNEEIFGPESEIILSN